MQNPFDLSRIIEPALNWYQRFARSLPFRNTKDPYAVWVSEIMLQQTRIETAVPYYERFTRELPDIKALAACPDERLLKLWEGLGYYSRVRNMKKAAQIIVQEYNGVFPNDYASILKLPGIGPYTAGAIASMAFSQPVPAVDGNVLRLLMRILGDDADIAKDSVKKKTRDALASLMEQTFTSRNDPRCGAFNQALMELGEVVCIPGGQPYCNICPMRIFCRAFLEERTADLPVKSSAKPRRTEEKTVLLVQKGDAVLVRKRPVSGLLAELYEFPSLSGFADKEEVLSYIRALPAKPLEIQKLDTAKHIFSHVEWHMQGYWIRLDETSDPKKSMIFATAEDLKSRVPIPSAFAFYMRWLERHLSQESAAASPL